MPHGHLDVPGHPAALGSIDEITSLLSILS